MATRERLQEGANKVIVGVGVDIIEIERVENLCLKPNALARLFTDQELAYAKACGHYAECLAGNFAAKEAMGKALGCGLKGLKWTDLEVVHNQDGKPEVCLHNQAKAREVELDISNIQLSISHDKTSAIAFVVAESLLF